jgi:Cu-Zn family superoxide dismutase
VMNRSKLLSLMLLVSLLATALLVLGACQKKEEAAEEDMGDTNSGIADNDPNAPTTATGAVSDTPAPGSTAATTARATLQGVPTDTDFSGTVTFTQDGDNVRVVADFAGIDTPGEHGFHIHETGECAHDPAGKHFTTAGGHWNPAGVEHACPPADPRHAGDLGNVQVGPNGAGRMELSTTGVTLTGADSIVGKAILLHAGEDDCKTQPTGNSGDRLACGVITLEGGGTAGNPGTGGQ